MRETTVLLYGIASGVLWMSSIPFWGIGCAAAGALSVHYNFSIRKALLLGISGYLIGGVAMNVANIVNG